MADEERRRLARDCIESGCASLASGDTAAAVPLLDRAHRLVPADPTAALLLASALAAEPAKAEAVLESAHRRNPQNRSILAALAAAAARGGQPARAASLLGAMLRGGAPLPDRSFTDMADRIARDSGAPGWIGLSTDGSLRISGRGVSLRVGDVPLPLAGRGAARTVILPEGWERSGRVTATARTGALIGSPIDVGAVLRVEGCITGQGPAGVQGWAWHPNDPDQPVRLALVSGGGEVLARLRADQAIPAMPAADGVTRARGFCIDPAHAAPGAAGPLWLRVPDGSLLPGGPIVAGGEAAAARLAAGSLAAESPADRWRPLPAIFAQDVPPPARACTLAGRSSVIVVLDPLHPMMAACLQSVAALRLTFMVVDAGASGDDPRGMIALPGGVHVRVPGGSGPALLNAGLRHASLLRPDGPLLLVTRPCVLPRSLPARLAAAMRADAATGLVQPLCLAMPEDAGDSAKAALRTDRLTRRCNAGRIERLAHAEGPVIALHPDCLRQTGLLRDEAFAGTAAALTDFAWRARHLGWHASLACDCFIAMPAESGPAYVRAALAARDAATLERLHPGSGRLPLPGLPPGADARRRIAMADWAEGSGRAKTAVIFVTHADGGGVERRVGQCAAAVRAEGGRAIVIRPGTSPAGDAAWRVSDGVGESHPDLWFRAPDEFAAMAEMLRADGASRVELHHAESHDEAICGLAPALGIPYDVTVHDFAMICPRVTCVGGTGRYCGEPADVSECDACIADHGARTGKLVPVARLRAASAALAQGARCIVAPSADAARRFRRHLPGPPPLVRPWEDDAALTAGVPLRPRRVSAGPVTVCLAGAIGQDKGFDVLLACARDAARRQLNLTFKLVGYTTDDERLMSTGRVFITGDYEEHEALALIRAQHADIGFLPSVWPETWCYALSALWRAGLWTLAFALGAPAERIAATGAGRTVPLGMPPARLNDLILGLFAPEAGAHG